MAAIITGGLLAALMTAFYMFRVYTLTFTGAFRGTHEQEHHLHESPVAMTFPLIALAILAVIGGYVELPVVISEHHALREFLGLNGSVVNAHTLTEQVEALGHNTEWTLIYVSIAIAIIGSALGFYANSKPKFAPNKGLVKLVFRHADGSVSQVVRTA